MAKYYNYLIELRHRLVILCVTWLFTVILSYEYKMLLFYILFYTNNTVSQMLTTNHFIFTNLTEIFSIYTHLIVFLANQVMGFYFFYHFFLFMAPGLYWFEYKRYRRFLRLFYFVCGGSILLFNKVIFPITWQFFLTFYSYLKENRIPIFFEAKIDQYLDHYINLYYVCLFVSIFVIFLQFVVLFTTRSKRKIRKYRTLIYVTMLLIATITTPPDVLSQVFLTIFLISIYETLIFYRMWVKILMR